MHHRILDRLRNAYVVGEDLTTHRLRDDNLHRIIEARDHAHDDPVLYRHWYGNPLPSLQAQAVEIELRLWNHLGDTLHELTTQGYYPDTFRAEADKLTPETRDLQELLHLEAALITRAATKTDEETIKALKARYP
jgi:hypothetical protein